MATEKVVVDGSSVTAGQLEDFFRQVKEGRINFYNLRSFLEGRDPFGISCLDLLKAYEKLGMVAEFAEFVKTNEAVLAPKPGLWYVPVLKGVTCNKVIAVFRKLGVDLYLYTNDLDADVTKNDRDPKKGSYLVSFAANVEADENFKNLSANQLAAWGVNGITLLERLILELVYFLTTGKHLDVENHTLCAGSRYSDGGVPHVDWGVGTRKLSVRWYGPGGAHVNLRTRAVS